MTINEVNFTSSKVYQYTTHLVHINIITHHYVWQSPEVAYN